MLEKSLSQVLTATRANELIPEGMNAAQVTAAVTNAVGSGEISRDSFDALIQGGFAVAGAALCSATGVGAALAPLCGAAGSLVGSLITGLFDDGPPPPPPAPSSIDLLNAERVNAYQYLTTHAEDLSAQFLAKMPDEASADAVAQLIEAYYPPTKGYGATGYGGVTFLVEAGDFPAFPDADRAGGFALPFLNVWYVLGQVWGVKPGGPWIEAYYDRIAERLESVGVPFATQAAALKKKAKEKGYNDTAPPRPALGDPENPTPEAASEAQGSALLNVSRDLRLRLWASLQEALQFDLKRVFVAASVRAKLGLITAIDDLAEELAHASGCETQKCRNEMRSIAAECAQLFEGGATVAQVLAEILPALPVPSAELKRRQRVNEALANASNRGRARRGRALSNPPAPPASSIGQRVASTLLVATAVAGGVAVGLAGVRVAQGKPAVPPVVREKASQVKARVKRVFSR